MNTIRIGIDFDNTIVNHDSVFYKYAILENLITPGVPATKHHIGRAIQRLPDGNTKWTELQGKVYGQYILESKPMPGVVTFFRKFNRQPIAIFIVSHRTQYPVIGPKVDLRRASLSWLTEHNFFTGLGLTTDRVYFADTLDEKIHLIDALQFNYFIDDLALVLSHKQFPGKTKKIYFNKHKVIDDPGIRRFNSWRGISRFIAERL